MDTSLREKEVVIIDEVIILRGYRSGKSFGMLGVQ
jgi:hypothetical protein